MEKTVAIINAKDIKEAYAIMEQLKVGIYPYQFSSDLKVGLRVIRKPDGSLEVEEHDSNLGADQ